jgi:hypothetical protein
MNECRADPPHQTATKIVSGGASVIWSVLGGGGGGWISFYILPGPDDTVFVFLGSIIVVQYKLILIYQAAATPQKTVFPFLSCRPILEARISYQQPLFLELRRRLYRYTDIISVTPLRILSLEAILCYFDAPFRDGYDRWHAADLCRWLHNDEALHPHNCHRNWTTDAGLRR